MLCFWRFFWGISRYGTLGGTANEPHGFAAVLWAILTNIPSVATLVLWSFLDSSLNSYEQLEWSLLNFAFLFGTSFGAIVFYDFQVLDKAGFRSYFESYIKSEFKKEAFLAREAFLAPIWSFAISFGGFASICILKVILNPERLLDSIEILLVQVCGSIFVTSLAVFIFIATYSREEYNSARGVIAGFVLRLSLFIGLVIS